MITIQQFNPSSLIIKPAVQLTNFLILSSSDNSFYNLHPYQFQFFKKIRRQQKISREKLQLSKKDFLDHSGTLRDPIFVNYKKDHIFSRQTTTVSQNQQIKSDRIIPIS